MKIDWGKILSSQEEFNKHLKKIRNEKAKNNQAVVKGESGLRIL